MPGRTPAARGPGLGFEFFGGPALWRDAEHVAVSPTQAALLSVAFGDGRNRVPRSLVQRLLWPEGHGRAVRHRASQLVYQANQRCGARVLAMEGEHLRVRREVVASDLDEFDARVAARDFGAACDLLERGFLVAVRRPRTDALADWIEERRLGARTRLRSAALKGWQAAENVQDWADARRAAQALLRMDPKDEAALRRVMRAQAMGGRVREAEAVYRAFADRAGSESGWSPAPETRRLFRSVRGGAALAGAAKSGGPKPFAATEGAGADPGADEARALPFLRRDAVLSRLNRGLHDSGGGLVTVSGEAGIGKTRLAEAAMRSVGFRGLRAVRASPVESDRHVPLSTLAGALNHRWAGPVVRQVELPWRRALAAALPASGWEAEGERPELLRNSWTGQVREAFCRLFGAMARAGPIVFFVDDFHWADEESASILHALCRPKRDLPFRLLLAYRPEELAGETPAGLLAHELEADSRSTAIKLDRLDDAAAREVAAAANPALFGSAVDSAHSRSADARLAFLLDEVVRLAGGNPRFLAALARHAGAERGDGAGGGDGTGKLGVPPSIRRLARRRIDGLGHAARKVLAGLAVFGRPASLKEAARLAACPLGECADALERLQELGMVEWSGGRAFFRHGVMSRAMYEEAAPARRAFAHGVAAALLRSARDGGPLDRIARHYHLAGDRSQARKHALMAESAASPADATSRLGLLKIARDASDGPERCAATTRLAIAHWDALHLREAALAGEAALACAGDLPASHAHRARLVLVEAGVRLGTLAPEAALAALGELEAEARNCSNEVLLVRALDARLALTLGMEDEAGAKALSLRFARSAPRLRDARAQCRGSALLAAGGANGLFGASVEAGRDAWRLAGSGHLDRDRMFAAARYVEALAGAGLLATSEGRAAVEDAKAESARTGDLHSRAAFLLAFADWQAGAGNRHACISALGELRALAAEPASCPPVQMRASIAEAAVALGRGDLATAGDAIAHAREAGASALPRDQRALAGLQGEWLLQSGRVRQATEIADRHPPEAEARAPLTLFLFHARLLSRTGRAAGAVAQLGQGLEQLDGRRNLAWLRIALEFVRLARRTGSPQRDMACRARDRAQELGLAGLAQDFGPFTR